MVSATITLLFSITVLPALTSERALFVIDKKGILRCIDVHDINKKPPLENLMGALEKLK